ncbi:hypothetical protein [Nocardia nova]|uniref:hypothetical protein n=1 Tax=Nocardia nova TaxID=37330 RepID=UPI0011B0716B|nr:hypothetical protein [Nocardia nova]
MAAARTHGTVVVTGVCSGCAGARQIDPAPFITDRVTLDGIGETFAALSANSGHCKVLVRP